MGERPAIPTGTSTGWAWVVGLLLTTALISGLVAMHSMSGPAVHGPALAASAGHDEPPHLRAHPAPPESLPASDTVASDAPGSVAVPATAMCVVALAGLLLFHRANKRSPSAARSTVPSLPGGPVAKRQEPHPPHPSPQRLGISRT